MSGDGPGEDAGTPVAPARAPARPPTVALAERIAGHLAEPFASLIGSCAKAGIPYRSVQRWLAEDADEGSVVEQFQLIVMDALERERVADLQKLEDDFEALGGPTVAKAAALVNKHVHYHTNRFKRFYADDDAPNRVELTGARGGPLKSMIQGSLTRRTAQQIANDFLGVPVELQEAGKKLGDTAMGSVDEDDEA